MITVKRPTSRASHEQFGYKGLETKPGGPFPYAWKGDDSTRLHRQEIDVLRCAQDGCTKTWKSSGGLARTGVISKEDGEEERIHYRGQGPYFCKDHRESTDEAMHRKDLRDAWGRVTVKAVTEERERIISLLETHDPKQVYQMLIEQRPKKELAE